MFFELALRREQGPWFPSARLKFLLQHLTELDMQRNSTSALKGPTPDKSYLGDLFATTTTTTTASSLSTASHGAAQWMALAGA
jgi:hypothetical protein